MEQQKTEKKCELIKSDVKLSIGILVSNNLPYIRKAMEALKPLLEAVPSELIAVDTVGEQTDGSIDIVRKYTDKIYPFSWCNDFAAARNCCLEHANGEWFMFQDDDEVFDDVTELIRFFQSGECEKYYTGYYHVKNYLSNGDSVMGIVGRLIRRTTSTKFVGRVHEHYNEEFAPKKEFGCFVHHYGYLYENEESRAEKQKRNLDILEAEIRENGITPQRAAQKVQELLSRAATREEGYRYCMESIKVMEQQKELKNSCSQWLLVASVRAFAGENTKMLEQAEYIRSGYALTQMAELVLAACAALAAAAENNRDLVEEYCELYLKNWDWRKNNEEEALQQTNMDFPAFYEEKQYYQMVHLAAQAANQAGKYRLANQHWKRLPWEKEGFDKVRYARDLNWTIEGLKQQQEQKKKEEKLLEIKSLIEVLAEAGMFLKTAVLQNQLSVQQELLIQMQETAIAVGTGIDQLLGEGTRTVALLEEYCELAWQCSNSETVEQKFGNIAAMDKLTEQIKKELE